MFASGVCRRVYALVVVAGLSWACLGLDGKAALASDGSTDWPGFRGKRVDGTVNDRENFVGNAGFRLHVKWKQPIGSGYSGVAVAGRTLVTMFSDGAADLIAAFDAETGAEAWRFELGPTYEGRDGAHTGPVATPLIAHGRAFGLHPLGRLVALDLGTGKLVWSVDLVKEHEAPKPHYGFGTSPLVMDGVLIVQIGAKDAAVAGFDPATGKRLWTAGADTVGYQSPIPYVLRGRSQVVAGGQKMLYGLDPKTGELLWEHAHGGSGARGVASLVPVSAGDAKLFLAHKDDGSTLIELAQDGDKVAVKTLWDDRSIRNSYNVPVYHDGFIYAFSSRFLTCVDAETGKAAWKSRQPGDGFLMLVNGHMVIITKTGSLHVAKASPEGYEELAAVTVFSDLVWSPPAFARGHVYLRGLAGLACVDVLPAATAQATVAAVPDTGDRAPSVDESSFARFLQDVAAATDKAPVVDRFMKTQKQFPVIEGNRWVHFIYRGPGEDLAVAGDVFGARQESPMTRVDGTNLFYHSISLEPDARTNYLFLRDYEEITDPLNPRKTKTALFGKEMEMSFSGAEMEMSWLAMPAWEEPAHLSPAEESRKGSIDSHERESEALEGKYTIDVYLPAGYKDSKRRYPVAYIHGGKTALDRGQLPNSLDNLIGRKIDPVIVVFINAQARGKDEPYAKMWATELIPFIDQTYRTIASPNARAGIGYGFAGYHAFMSALKQPGVVGRVATESLFIFDSMKAGLRAAMDGDKSRDFKVFMEWGKYDFRNPHEAWDLGETNRLFAQELRDKGYDVHGHELNDGTGWSSWRNRTGALFQWLFPLGSMADGA